MTLVWLEPTTPQSLDKLSTTESLHLQMTDLVLLQKLLIDSVDTDEMVLSLQNGKFHQSSPIAKIKIIF